MKSCAIEFTLVVVGIVISFLMLFVASLFSMSQFIIVSGILGIASGGYFYYRMDHACPFVRGKKNESYNL